MPSTNDRAEIGPNALSDIDLAIYPQALSPARIVAHYQAGIGDLGVRGYHRYEAVALNDSIELKVNVPRHEILAEGLVGLLREESCSWHVLLLSLLKTGAGWFSCGRLCAR